MLRLLAFMRVCTTSRAALCHQIFEISCVKSISDWKQKFLPECNNCALKKIVVVVFLNGMMTTSGYKSVMTAIEDMKSYIIPSLVAAGFVSPRSNGCRESELAVEDHMHERQTPFLEPDGSGNLPVTLAGHSSHASHGSHGSHRSSATPRSYSPATPAPAPAVPHSSPKVKQKPNNATPPVSVSCLTSAWWYRTI